MYGKYFHDTYLYKKCQGGRLIFYILIREGIRFFHSFLLIFQ